MLSAKGRVFYGGKPVTFASIADGDDAFSVVSGGRVVARGILPGIAEFVCRPAGGGQDARCPPPESPSASS